ncbi:MAG TPA: hypothetical protein VJ961_04635 [Mariprofundaceae bacterium]|nr:hypothetical protein [Mariprofundaceae bacterium]
MPAWHRVSALGRIIFLDGLRRHALVGLVLLSLAAEVSGFLFMDFFGRDIGRASSDFLFSVIWAGGLMFLFFHAVQVISWDEERKVIYTILSRPLSRAEYVLGVFTGLLALLIGLQLLLGTAGYATLLVIKHSLATFYFQHLSLAHYLLTWAGLAVMQTALLAVIMLFSGMVRGGFPVLLLSVAYYGICAGLPVVRDSVDAHSAAGYLLQILTALFPDFSRLDFKDMVVSNLSVTHGMQVWMNFGLVLLYIGIVTGFASRIYARRDLQ